MGKITFRVAYRLALHTVSKYCTTSRWPLSTAIWRGIDPSCTIIWQSQNSIQTQILNSVKGRGKETGGSTHKHALALLRYLQTVITRTLKGLSSTCIIGTAWPARTLSGWWGSAWQCANKYWTTSRWPANAAIHRGVRPFYTIKHSTKKRQKHTNAHNMRRRMDVRNNFGDGGRSGRQRRCLHKHTCMHASPNSNHTHTHTHILKGL